MTAMTMKPGTARVLALLRQRPNGITWMDALEAGCGSRLGARVWELRHLHGHDVREQLIVVPTRGAGTSRVALYRLHEEPVQLDLGVVA